MANNDIREQSFSPICMGRMFRMISVANFHLSGPHREQHMFVNFQQIYGKQMWNHKPKMEYGISETNTKTLYLVAELR